MVYPEGVSSMKNPHEVLQQKEADLARVRNEVESLRIVTSLLAGDDPSSDDPELSSGKPNEQSLAGAEEIDSSSGATGTDSLLPATPPCRPRLWNVLKPGR
jgi:hypothetical protein